MKTNLTISTLLSLQIPHAAFPLTSRVSAKWISCSSGFFSYSSSSSPTCCCCASCCCHCSSSSSLYSSSWCCSSSNSYFSSNSCSSSNSHSSSSNSCCPCTCSLPDQICLPALLLGFCSQMIVSCSTELTQQRLLIWWRRSAGIGSWLFWSHNELAACCVRGVQNFSCSMQMKHNNLCQLRVFVLMMCIPMCIMCNACIVCRPLKLNL